MVLFTNKFYEQGLQILYEGGKFFMKLRYPLLYITDYALVEKEAL